MEDFDVRTRRPVSPFYMRAALTRIRHTGQPRSRRRRRGRGGGGRGGRRWIPQAWLRPAAPDAADVSPVERATTHAARCAQPGRRHRTRTEAGLRLARGQPESEGRSAVGRQPRVTSGDGGDSGGSLLIDPRVRSTESILVSRAAGIAQQPHVFLRYFVFLFSLSNHYRDFIRAQRWPRVHGRVACAHEHADMEGPLPSVQQFMTSRESSSGFRGHRRYSAWSALGLVLM